MAFVEVEAWRFEEADLGSGVSLYVEGLVVKVRVDGVVHTIMHNLQRAWSVGSPDLSGYRPKRSFSIKLPWRLLVAPAAERVPCGWYCR